jgi:membrane associated rhomboid family serine protease
MNNFLELLTTALINFQRSLPTVLIMIAGLWGLHILNWLSGYRLNLLGIYPRSARGIPGIAFSPFLHGHFTHLFFNSIPLCILATFVMMNGLHYFLLVSLCIIILSGFGIWLLGRKAIHIGASALIMGYMGFLLMNAYYQGTEVAIAIGLVCIYYFGSILLSILPSDVKVSWEGHLFGLLAGVLTAYLIPML